MIPALKPPTRAAITGGTKMTAFLNRIARKTALVLTAAACFSAFAPNAGFAFSSEAQQQCTGDAFRLCGSEIPNVAKITACMIKQRASLSAGCRSVMDRDLASKTKVAAQ
jgi:hypothetical protein